MNLVWNMLLNGITDKDPGSTPGLLLERSLYVQPVSAWVFSRFSVFPPQSKKHAGRGRLEARKVKSVTSNDLKLSGFSTLQPLNRGYRNAVTDQLN